MRSLNFDTLTSAINRQAAISEIGRVSGTENGCLVVTGLAKTCRLGDRVCVDETGAIGEVLRLSQEQTIVLIAGMLKGISVGDKVRLLPRQQLCPDESWLGQVINADGNALNGNFMVSGEQDYAQKVQVLSSISRKKLGARLETGMRLFNTLLPLARGQRLGLFAGSGVGKSTLLGHFAKHLETDVTVIALVGERGREVREFVDVSLGEAGLKRSVVVVATSDQSPLEKRQAAWTAMSVAEYFRDQGKQVLLLVDSLTRVAEAHREIALAGGESASMRGFPPSTTQVLMSLCERAGPGILGMGDITAVFSVLVASSDMEEPLADIVRGVLDGHIVLDRKIAERGRFPAVDLLRSVSRSLPAVGSDEENKLIQQARKILGTYEASELMIKAGLYNRGSDDEIDRSISLHPKLDTFLSGTDQRTIYESFDELRRILHNDQADQETVRSNIN